MTLSCDVLIYAHPSPLRDWLPAVPSLSKKVCLHDVSRREVNARVILWAPILWTCGRGNVQEERSGVLIQELIAVKFELAEKTLQLNKLQRAVGVDSNSNTNLFKSETKDSTPAGGRTQSGADAGLGDDADDDDEHGDHDSDLHSREMLYLAAEEGLDEIVKGILVPTCTKRHTLGVTFGHAIRRAASGGHVGIIKRLLSAGGRMDTRSADEDYLHRTCLHTAAAGGHEPVVRLILAQCKERLVRVLWGF